jgi:3'(2'), 5'-bisphosphate nucleotidase
MNIEEAKKITYSLIDTFNRAGNIALSLRDAGLIKEIKSDNTPVTNGDI